MGQERSLHITIGAFPSNMLSLDTDLQMVKAALLYADRVKLCSFASSLVISILALRQLTPGQQLELFETFIQAVKANGQTTQNRQTDPEHYGRQRDVKAGGGGELLQRLGGQAEPARAWNDFKEEVDKLSHKAGTGGILRAVQSGMLELHVFTVPEDIEAVVTEFLEVISDAVSDGSTYPLFDDATGQLVRVGLREGALTVSEAGVARGRHSGLAAHLLERLPLFEAATVDEILDIRSELELPLVRFRGAIARFSEDIRIGYWDKDFPNEAEEVFYREVAPAILEIEESLKTNRYLHQLTEGGSRSLAEAATLSMAIHSLASLPEITSAVLGGGISAVSASYRAYREWKQSRQEAEKNQLFFYYQTGKRLERRG